MTKVKHLCRYTTLFIVLTILLTTGCSKTSTSQRIGLISEAYILSTNEMTISAKNGLVSLDDALLYESFREPVEVYITTALDDLLDGDDNTSRAENAIDILIPILDAMLEAQREAVNE